MKKVCIFVLLISASFVNVFSLDFGFYISNDTSVVGTGNAVGIAQANRLLAWLETPTGSMSSLYISLLYDFYGFFPVKPKQKPTLRPYSFTAGRVEWAGYAVLGDAVGMGWSVGRIPFSDYSGKILKGLFDGFKLDVSHKRFKAAFAAGYTGLTFKEDASIRIDSDDVERLTDRSFMLAPYRLFIGFTPSLAEVIPSHDIGCDIWAQFDLEKNPTHTQYIEPYIEGRIGRNISWKWWGIVQFGKDTQFFYSMGSGLGLSYFMPEWLNFRASALLQWAAGDYDGAKPMRSFIPITMPVHTTVSGKTFGNILTTSLGVSIQPLLGLTTGVSYTLLTAPQKGTPAYTGSELSGKIAYSMSNDLDISFFSGIFIPNKAIPPASIRWLATLSFTVHL